MSDTPPTRLLAADWLASMDAPVRRDGAVVVRAGRIVGVGDRDALVRAHPEAEVEELGAAVLLPGLVNAHVHLELSTVQRGAAPEHFIGWLGDVMRSAPADDGAVALAVQRGVEQSLRFGVTCVGDISRQCGVTRPILSRGPLRVISFGELAAMARRRGFLEERLAVAADQSAESERLTIGLSPHAPYSIEAEGYAAALEVAKRIGRPLATHLAETADEAAFLGDHAGPFRELWERIGDWDEQVPRFSGGPVRYAKAIGLIDFPSVLAHVNYADDEELEILAAGKASVVYCPRTHAYFGHPPHRWRNMMERGIDVAVGTDSAASSPDLNLLDDLRMLHALAPDAAPEMLFRMATLAGAKALGLDGERGSLAVGKVADVIAIPVRGDRPLEEILESRAAALSVWINGNRVTV